MAGSDPSRHARRSRRRVWGAVMSNRTISINAAMLSVLLPVIFFCTFIGFGETNEPREAI
jgi:hypothetical protein